MSWKDLQVAACNTHHLDLLGNPAYEERYDEVLKFHAPGLAPVRRGEEAWHIHASGLPAYGRRFERTFGFYEDRAAVTDREGWHHIDVDGQDVYAERFMWCGNYQGGRCTVRESNGHYLHIDTAGRAVYDERWRYAGDYRDGVAVVQAEDGRSTHIDADGRHIHGCWFLDLDVYHKGFARARDEAGWTHIDPTGAPAYARRFSNVEPFYNGQARVERLDGGLEVIDESGTTLIELRPALRSEFAALSADMVGFWKTQTIAAAVDLGVIDALPGEAESLAHHCQLQPDRATRLLRALGELGLTVQEGQVWRLTTRGTFLRTDHPLTLADAAKEYAGTFSQMWRSLPNALRGDRNWEVPDIFREVAQDKGRLESHHRMLRSYARHDYPSVPFAFGLQERSISLMPGAGWDDRQPAARLLPNLKVTVLDLPEIIEYAQSQHPERQGGLEWRAADLFKPWEVKADAVVLARVLHDWDDTPAARFFSRHGPYFRQAENVFVVEMVHP